jgi:Carbohydrate binding domain
MDDAKTIRILLKVAVVMSLLFMAYRPAVAGNINLVVNPGVETGDLTGWTVTNAPVTFVDSSDPKTGTYELNFENAGSDAIFSQTITDIIGQNYTFSFWVQPDGDTPTDFWPCSIRPFS